jgi:hypothetical protein
VTIDEAGAGPLAAEPAAGGACAATGKAATIEMPTTSDPACRHRARRIIFEKAPRGCGRMQNRPMDCAASEAA